MIQLLYIFLIETHKTGKKGESMNKIFTNIAVIILLAAIGTIMSNISNEISNIIEKKMFECKEKNKKMLWSILLILSYLPTWYIQIWTLQITKNKISVPASV